MHKVKIILIAVAGLMAAGAIYFFGFRTSYQVVHPTVGKITEAVYGLAKLKSDRSFEVIVGVMSTVRHLNVQEGMLVKKGDPIVTFDSGAVFRAPFKGTITNIAVHEGSTAWPGTPVIRLEDLTNLYLELALEQQAIARVKLGQKAKVVFDSERNEVLNGTVAAIFPKEDEFITHIKIEGLGEKNLLPGMSADVSIETGSIENAVMIPVKAVQSGMITVRRKGSWEKVKIETGHVDGLFAEVKGNSLSTADELKVKADK
jgi:multidrug efflux pump subunit AcrA (membrane-fusion protein)